MAIYKCMGVYWSEGQRVNTLEYLTNPPMSIPTIFCCDSVKFSVPWVQYRLGNGAEKNVIFLTTSEVGNLATV